MSHPQFDHHDFKIELREGIQYLTKNHDFGGRPPTTIAIVGKTKIAVFHFDHVKELGVHTREYVYYCHETFRGKYVVAVFTEKRV